MQQPSGEMEVAWTAHFYYNMADVVYCRRILSDKEREIQEIQHQKLALTIEAQNKPTYEQEVRVIPVTECQSLVLLVGVLLSLRSCVLNWRHTMRKNGVLKPNTLR